MQIDLIPLISIIWLRKTFEMLLGHSKVSDKSKDICGKIQ